MQSTHSAARRKGSNSARAAMNALREMPRALPAARGRCPARARSGPRPAAAGKGGPAAAPRRRHSQHAARRAPAPAAAAAAGRRRWRREARRIWRPSARTSRRCSKPPSARATPGEGGAGGGSDGPARAAPAAPGAAWLPEGPDLLSLAPPTRRSRGRLGGSPAAGKAEAGDKGRQAPRRWSLRFPCSFLRLCRAGAAAWVRRGLGLARAAGGRRGGPGVSARRGRERRRQPRRVRPEPAGARWGCERSSEVGEKSSAARRLFHYPGWNGPGFTFKLSGMKSVPWPVCPDARPWLWQALSLNFIATVNVCSFLRKNPRRCERTLMIPFRQRAFEKHVFVVSHKIFLSMPYKLSTEWSTVEKN